MAILLGTGLALNSTVAIIEALLGVRNTFRRTPKFMIEGPEGGWRNRSYVLPVDRMVWGESILALYALLTLAAAIEKGSVQSVPLLAIYVLGFGFVSILGWLQGRGRKAEKDARLKAKRGPAS